jgi:hypothetical protein
MSLLWLLAPPLALLSELYLVSVLPLRSVRALADLE